MGVPSSSVKVSTTTKDPARVTRGRNSIATARANGKFDPEPTTIECEVCHEHDEVPPSRRNKFRRCRRCIEKGRALCAACLEEIRVAPASGGHPLCDECKAAGHRGPTLRPKEAEYEPCIGAKTPWGQRWSKRCEKRGRLSFRPLRPSEVNDYKRRRPKQKGYRCRGCKNLENRVAADLKLLNSLGRRPISYDDFLTELKCTSDHRAPGRHPDFMAQQGKYPAAAIEARRAGRGGLSGPARSLSTLVNTWRKDSNGWEIRQCSWCQHTLMVSTAPTAKRPEMHGVCWSAWRSEKGQRWATRPRTRRKTAPSIRKRPGKHRTPETLTRNFRWAILHHLGGDTQNELCEQFGFDPSTMSKAIRDSIDLLPDLEVADKRFRRYVKALKAAS